MTPNTAAPDTVALDTATAEAGSPKIDASSAGLAGLNVRHLAAEGYFQAIAYWLNEPLVPQNVYAQVLADPSPGCIKVLVEFERAPEPKRLLKFVCDRIYKLNSNVIEGIHLVARAVGASKTDWAQRIRIPTASARKAKTAAPASSQLASSQPASDQPEAAHSAANQSGSQLLHESSRSRVARDIVRSQFKFFRAALISGTASAAFLFGGLTELVLSERLSTPTAAETASAMTPWYENGSQENGSQDTTEVAFRAGEQDDQASTQQLGQRFHGRTVEAALETVAVIPHDEVAYPDDPTVTLLFGGELALDDFVFEAPESLDRLFSDLSIYQQADVAMVGLSEPLATASTSLQESFYHRTRPQAVQALQRGGIDIVSLASEGSLTYGTRGLDETLRTLDRQGLYRVGAGRNQQEAHRPEILEVKGQRIAYLGYNSEALKAAKADKAGVALTNSEDQSHILEDIRAIRPQVDWVVVNYRWGDTLDEANSNEANSEKSGQTASEVNPLAIPKDWQRSLAHEAVDAGADLVVGYHPSQIQGAEIYRDRAIAYSLGDFVFGEAPLEDHDTAALRVSLRNHQMKIEFLPVSIRNSQLQMATGEHGTQILQGIRNASNTFDQPLNFPTVLQALPTHLPTTDLPTTAPAITHPATTHPAVTPLRPSSPTAPTPLDFIETSPTVVPDTPEPAPFEYEGPAPHPLLKESEALFPAEDESPTESVPEDDSFIELAPEDDSFDSFIESAPLEDEGKPQSVLPDSIEPYEEPLTGPLSAL
ncbi:MAG: CapA family protein [Phormidesmis sp.]